MNRIVTWLLKLRILVPYENIGTYMGRWWLIRERRGMPLAARIHNIKRSDAGRDLHNHPWWYCTLILAGGYWEHTEITEAEYWDLIVSLRGDLSVYNDLTGRYFMRRWRGAGSLSFHGLRFRHRLEVDPDTIANGGTWTLFIHGRRVRGWGFFTSNGFVPQANYLKGA